MYKNVASQKVTLLAIDVSTNTPKTGDAANLTAYASKDDGTVTVLGDTSATELDATNAPGLYSFDLTQAETNYHKILFSGKSTTANVKLIPLLVFTVSQTPDVNVSTITAGAITNASLHADTGLKPDYSCTLQSGSTSTTAKLDTGASSTTNFWQDAFIRIVSGTGAGQSSTVTAYNGTTKVCAIADTWTTTPDATSVVVLLPAVQSLADIVAAVLAGQIGDSTITIAQALRIILAVAAGKADNGGTTPMHFRDTGDTKNVVTATVDSSGNRTAVTLNP